MLLIELLIVGLIHASAVRRMAALLGGMIVIPLCLLRLLEGLLLGSLLMLLRWCRSLVRLDLLHLLSGRWLTTRLLGPDYSSVLAKSASPVAKHDLDGVLVWPLCHDIDRVNSRCRPDLDSGMDLQSSHSVRQLSLLALLLCANPRLTSFAQRGQNIATVDTHWVVVPASHYKL